MPKLVDITVTESIEAPIDEVYAELVDCHSFGDWWPVNTKPLEGEQLSIDVSPLPLVHIYMVQQADPCKEAIVYEYARGPFRGGGTWSLEEEGERTKISYRIQLRPIHFLFVLATSTPMFRWKHIWDIKQIIRRLDKRLKARRGRAPSVR